MMGIYFPLKWVLWEFESFEPSNGSSNFDRATNLISGARMPQSEKKCYHVNRGHRQNERGTTRYEFPPVEEGKDKRLVSQIC